MAKDTFYFSHDYNARNDAKIKKLISKHGFLGYGIFWAIVEDLYNNANALPTDYESIAFDLRTDAETIKSIIKDFDLFVFENETFGSSSIEKRLNERNEKSIKARESASKRWSKLKEDANALRTQSDGNAIKESIVKENKENVNKDNNSAIPTIKEFLDYCKTIKEINFTQYEFSLKTKYETWVDAKWVDGNGNKIKNWKTKIKSVIPYLKPSEQKQENKSIYSHVPRI